MAEINQLVKKRGSCKLKLTSFAKHVNKIKTSNLDNQIPLVDVVKLELQNRVDNIKQSFVDFDKIQSNIEELTDNEEDTVDYRETFEKTYFESVALAQSLIAQGIPVDRAPPGMQQRNAQNNQQDNALNVNFHANQPLGVKLPTIELPKFRGELSEWLGFRDTFSSLIHDNNQISNIQKFHYLRAAVEGDAEQIIKSLEFSAANYLVAWEALRTRFDNTNLLVQNHLKSIFNIEPIQKESASQLRQVVDTLNKHLRALTALRLPTQHWDALLIYMISTKLDKITARAWEKEKTDNEIITLENLKRFLKGRADMLETLEINNLQIDKNTKIKPPQSSSQTKVKSFLTKKLNCLICDEDHHLQNCSKFLSLSPQQRVEKIKPLKICLNCLRPNHFIKDCKSQGCKKCQMKHNTLLHFEKATTSDETNSSRLNNSKSVTSCCINIANDGVLSTASVLVENSNKKLKTARAILDNGSQTGLITKKFANFLNLEKIPIDVTLNAVNNLASNIKYRCVVQISSKQCNFTFKISCLIVPEITTHSPHSAIKSSTLEIPSYLPLADPDFGKSGKIDILIGNNIFWNLISLGQVKLNNEGLLLQKTRLGWILAGPTPNLCLNPVLNTVNCNLIQTLNLETQLTKFWELDEHFESKPKTLNDKYCESFFEKTTKRDENGKFIVTIPLKGNLDQLGESKEQALRRFLNLEKRLKKNPELKTDYNNFMIEYENLGHMTEVLDEFSVLISYYIPQLIIIRESSSSTRVRVVFDSSSPTSSGVSFNDLQMVGPLLQEDLFSILVRFRKHVFVVCGDITKMYRQILVTEEQRPLQRILWRPDENGPIKIYNLNTVTYGTAAASYLAIRCLHQIALDCENTLPEIAKVIQHDFYVDDFVSGSDSIEGAKRIAKKVFEVLLAGGYELRKWISNDPRVIEDLVDFKNNAETINFSNDDQIKMLGLTWQANSDRLLYSVNVSSSNKITKRQILSDIARIFDPLGLLGPCIVIAKILLQRLWLEKVSWDECLPVEINAQWLEYRRQLPNLNALSIPRRIVCLEPANIEIHGFSDAAKNAYGACVYLRSEDASGNIQVQLICSKSRVSPLKTKSIPRLELCGALELAKLTAKVTKALDTNINSTYYWCDSTIVLCWLRAQSGALETFVGNRVSQIQDLTEIDCWRHVRSENNPADCISRGVAPNLLASLKLWWQGPEFLFNDKSEWPSNVVLPDDVPGFKKGCNLLTKEI
ncbi:uncharacterized protein LOC122501502 [Leptopilina heterotoma]|uniref:uncharacterized protein LOC122501502 n=1 Tax=Leptopilina heterotoma TaxID=63436 RepID=UPI001CA80F39|nr:uncharacterized protein LOC122501502 [Leptopilina heterotoma]XP_043466956.1 uncharacterized protein LOC122501502 [Leptopilina heterotoma]XP_043466957.1 uncharacterized protein LOC122501502 [Leptopilina heterotoma]